MSYTISERAARAADILESKVMRQKLLRELNDVLATYQIVSQKVE